MADTNLYKMVVDEKDLGRVLVVMAKEWGLTILNANVNDEAPYREKGYIVYFECTYPTLKLFQVHLENSNLHYNVLKDN